MSGDAQAGPMVATIFVLRTGVSFDPVLFIYNSLSIHRNAKVIQAVDGASYRILNVQAWLNVPWAGAYRVLEVHFLQVSAHPPQ